MPIYGTTSTGRTWPTELEVSRLDAPAIEYVLDPALPIIGTDPNFDSDKVIIARGRLVGVKADAGGHTGTNLTTSIAHKSILTIADGVNVAPMGYAKSAIVRDWATKAWGVMPDINRNAMIAVPYIKGVNDQYGLLKQGDAVTALNTSDPRYKGAIVKFVGAGIYKVSGVSSTGTGIKNTGCPVGLAAPEVVAAYAGDGSSSVAKITVEAATTGANTGYYQVKSSDAGPYTVYLAYGQSAAMKAGNVWGIEGIEDFPGWLKWVETNFGSYTVPPLFRPYGNNVAAADYDIDLQSAGYCYLKSGSDVITRKIAGDKPIQVIVKAGQTVYAYNEQTGSWDKYEGGAVLPMLDAQLGNYCMGANYMVDPVSARITFFGLAKDSSGTAMSEAELEAALKVNCTLQALGSEPAYGSGIESISDPTNPSAPISYTKDPVTGEASIGILRVAIL